MTDPLVAAFRTREYPELDATHLNSASYGLLPRVTVEAVTSMTRRRNRPGGIPDAEPGAVQRRARAAAAALLGAHPREISLVPNTSFGIQLAASLVSVGPPGRIVVSDGEFPANVLPWLPLRERGFEVRVVPLRDGLPDEVRLAEEVAAPGARALSVSAVQFASGYRVDLAGLGRACREAGAFFFVDAIQALGTLPLEPATLGIDLLATGGQKWLCAPWGSGFAWVDPRHRDAIPPPVISWLAVEGGATFTTKEGYGLDFVADGRRFEPATLGVQDYLGLAVSIEALLEVGIDRIRAHLLALHAPVLDWASTRDDVRIVTPADEDRRGAILALDLPDAPEALVALDAAGIRAAVREGLLRLAPHLYVDGREMERTIGVLDRFLGR